MLEHELLTETGILIVRPKGPLAARDFAALSVDADAYIEAHGALNGLMICAEEFPGWENLLSPRYVSAKRQRSLCRHAIRSFEPDRATSALAGPERMWRTK